MSLECHSRKCDYQDLERIISLDYCINLFLIKGDGNDGEPDARRKLEFEKKGQIWLELKNYGWFGMIFENIQSDLPNEVRGQS